MRWSTIGGIGVGGRVRGLVVFEQGWWISATSDAALSAKPQGKYRGRFKPGKSELAWIDQPTKSTLALWGMMPAR